MGDVYDAMNRADKESEGSGHPAPGDGASNEPSGLPVEEMISDEAKAAGSEAPPTPRGAVTMAANRLAAETAALEQVESADPAHDDIDEHTSLNGYSPVIITHHDRGSVITEQYRAIRTQILARGRNRRLQVNVLTSASPNEGKSVTTINLGVTFSELRNQKTLLIEGDLRRPTFAKLFQRKSSPGLVQLLKGERDRMEDVINPTVYDNLQLIPAGGSDAINSTELLSSPRMTQMLERARDLYDHIFIDTPPVLSVTDASILGALGDQTILVVRLNKTPSDLVERTKRLLRAANCDVAGVVLTHLEHPSSRYLYKYRYYRSY
ncbi:MAG: hypothetical protein CMJ18_10485 [Phycisphaeraceae bacterium]|nr:hypothetical protein [Phycisphaeraceae bacterium]